MLYVIAVVIIVIFARLLCTRGKAFCNNKIHVCINRSNMGTECHEGKQHCSKFNNCRIYERYKIFYHFFDVVESIIVYSLLPAISLYCMYTAVISELWLPMAFFALFTFVFSMRMINKLKVYKYDTKRKQKQRIKAFYIGIVVYFFLINFVFSKI